MKKLSLKKIVIATSLILSLATTSNAQITFGIPDNLTPKGLQEGVFGSSIGTNNSGQDVYGTPQQVPSNEEGYIYSMGQAPIDRISLPPVPSIVNNSSSRWRAGLGYSCGNFNPFANIQQAINHATNQLKKMPQAFVSSVQESVAALPSYLMNQMNPTLYNTITKQLDDAFELFEINYQSCRQIEAGISNNAGTYFDFIDLSRKQKQLSEIANNDGTTPIDVVQERVAKADGSEGIAGIGGKMYGGAGQPEINYTKQVVTAGYNMLIGRKDTTDTSKANDKSMPLVKAFPSPLDAFDWVEKLYGYNALQFSTENSKAPSHALAGRGIRYQLDFRRNIIHSYMNQLINKNISAKDFQDKTEIIIPAVEIDNMRSMSAFARTTAISSKAKLEAKRDLQMRLRFIRQIIEGGLKEPDLAQSLMSNNTKTSAMELLMQIERDLHELNNLMNEG